MLTSGLTCTRRERDDPVVLSRRWSSCSAAGSLLGAQRTLRLLGGLTVAEIASAFLVDEAAMAKRLTRSKQKIKATLIPYRVPPDAEPPNRLRGVLATLFLVLNEGYLSVDPE